MHESGLMSDLMNKITEVAQREGAQGVKSITVSLGALSHLTPEHFREHFEDAAAGSIAEGAVLNITCETNLTASDAQGIRLESLELVG